MRSMAYFITGYPLGRAQTIKLGASATMPDQSRRRGMRPVDLAASVIKNDEDSWFGSSLDVHVVYLHHPVS
jgi:hypothetical protein